MSDLISKLRRNLERQQQTLKDTMSEIEHVRRVAPTAQSLIDKLEQKRNRQNQAVLATQQHIEILSKPDPKKK